LPLVGNIHDLVARSRFSSGTHGSRTEAIRDHDRITLQLEPGEIKMHHHPGFGDGHVNEEHENSSGSAKTHETNAVINMARGREKIHAGSAVAAPDLDELLDGSSSL